MQSEYSRSHLLKAYARQCANTVGIQAESTNRKIDYDVRNDIRSNRDLALLSECSRPTAFRLHNCQNAVGRLYSDRNNGQFVCR
jgi:hypothetical protein